MEDCFARNIRSAGSICGFLPGDPRSGDGVSSRGLRRHVDWRVSRWNRSDLPRVIGRQRPKGKLTTLLPLLRSFESLHQMLAFPSSEFSSTMIFKHNDLKSK